jgi:transposase
MGEVTTIGLDLAKQVFHVHGADASGSALFSRKLTRSKLLGFFAAQPRCRVAMEACGGAHHWGRELERLGHDVRLIPPAYVKPFVKRQKNDARDAEAICEAAQRPGMRFVGVKDEAQQASAALFRARDLLVRQRTQLINTLRGLVAEHGWVAPRGRFRMAR